MKISPHAHIESPLTGSTIADMLHRAKELGRTHFFFADHGHLSSALKVARVMKDEEKRLKTKLGLKLIPGIEIYFKDINCPIIAGTKLDRCKYFSLTLYCEDQVAYQELCRIVSRTDMPMIEVYEEKQQLWAWADLERISKFNVNVVLGGVHCMVSKPMLDGRADLGELVLQHLKSMFAGRIYAALVCEPWTKKYSQIVEIKYLDGTRSTCRPNDLVTTDRARRIKASDLLERSGHKVLKGLSTGGMYQEVEKPITSVKLHKGFLPFPGGDATLKVNRFLKALSKKHHYILLASDYAYYANKEDKIVQTMRLEGNNKLQPNLHMKSTHEIQDYLCNTLGMQLVEVDAIFSNNGVWAARFDNLKLKYDWRLADPGEDPLAQAMKIIKDNGRMRWDDPVWVDRLQLELNVIAKNPKKDLTAYFLPIRDVLNHYKENGLLTGPGRGSAGGSLFCYLLGITQVNPFKYDLPFNRFFSMERIMMGKLPDIDVDLESRELLVGEDGKSGYLYGRWGNKAAQVGTRTTIRLKSAIKDTNRYFNGKVESDIEVFTKGLPAPPQGVTDHDFVFGFEDDEGTYHPGLIEQSDDLKKYSESRPKEWEIVSKAMGLTRAYSKHASAFVLSDVPIQDVVPVKDGNVTQYEAKECEAAGLIKYDFLVINQLKDVRVCMDLINKKCGEKLEVGNFMHNGAKTYIWDLPEILEVYQSIHTGNCEAIFQISTRSMTPAVVEIMPTELMHVANILALIRPGPVDCIDPETGRNMVEEYYLRRKGMAEPSIKELATIISETYGIMIFQEQLGKIAMQLAGFTPEVAEQLRENMAKKKKVELMNMKPQFIEGATPKVGKETAEAIWSQMETFGRYGFSIIHAVEYAMITYACMFLKHYYPLEWWAAILTNATEQEITGKFWPYVKDIVSPPDINLSGDTMVVDYKNEKIRAKMGIIRGMGEASIDPIVNGRPYKSIQEFVDKEVAGPSLSHKLIHVGVLDSLFAPKSTLLQKLKAFEDAVEIKKFNEKVEKAKLAGKKLRALQPKEGVVPEGYINLHPLADAAMKKSVLPSMPINLHELGKRYSKVLAPFESVPSVTSANGYATMLINGHRLQCLDEASGDAVTKDVYIAATCYVIKAEEFSYAKGTKRALKMTLDADGYVSEKVLWPGYKSGVLEYPIALKKGAIVTVFFQKKAGRKDMSVMSVTVETEEKKPVPDKTDAETLAHFGLESKVE
jgi:DNA-directed DNA polymerase III PolC